MKNTARILLTTATVATLGVTLAGCTINIGVPGQQDQQQGGSMTSEQNSSGYSQRDLMFAQMMIPHHQQAVDMSTLAEKQTTNAELLALAKQIKDAQAQEIEQMQGWLDASGDTGGDMNMQGDMGHDGGMMDNDMMDGMMGGMLTDEEFDRLAGLSGAEFDQFFLESMIVHHEGALQMVRMITNSSNAEAKALGESIVESQTAEIEQMKQMLAAL